MAADVVEGIFAVDEGDEVSVAVDDYSWKTPMEVVDVEHVEWTAADGDPWKTREVVIEGGYGSTFIARVVDDQDDDVELLKDSGAVRGVLEQFDPVDVQEADDEDSDDVEADDEDSEDADDELTPTSVHPDEISDPLDDTETGQNETSDGEPTLPDGLVVDDVHTAADRFEYLDDVAEALDVSPQKARSVLVNVGRYADVSEASRYRGGVSK